MRLHYLPEDDPNETGRWLPGYPASDHDEDDPHRIAVMLMSGLYAEAPESESTAPIVVSRSETPPEPVEAPFAPNPGPSEAISTPVLPTPPNAPEVTNA